MTPEAILHSDVLDIIFENRNKQYGAYTLRREYNRRLITALIIMLLVVLVLSLSSLFKKPAGETVFTTVVDLTDTLQLIKPVEKLPEPKKVIQNPVATIRNPPPLIVPDHLATDTMHTQEELEHPQIGLQDKKGDTLDVVQPVNSDNSGSGNETTAPEPPAPEPDIWLSPEVMPEYPGGIEALRHFLGRNLNVPEDAVEPGQRIKIPVKFVVNKDGNLSGVEFLVQPDERFKKEILRVMGKMPKWKPGSQHGKTVNVYYTIPIIFEMPEG